MTFQQIAHSVLIEAESFGTYVEKGLATIKDARFTAQLVRLVPELAPIVAKLVAVIPVVGEVEAGISLSDFGVEHLGEIVALGKIAHFAPADALNYAPFKNDTGDTGFSDRG